MRRIAVRRTRERVTAVVASAAAAGALAAPAAAAPTWRLEQPPPPPGAQFKVPLGPPGDLKFWSRNRGLLGVEGNSTVQRGLYYWNGATWRQLATVCGGTGDTMRIAWAGPTEWWTISQPSLPRIGNGTALCHFKDGAVVGSYSTPEESRDPYRQMDAAACNGPNDCWFGGFVGQTTTGERRGGFHLHWDGTKLTSVYAPQGRAVSDIVFWNGSFIETMFRGGRPESRTAPDLAQPESEPALIHNLGGGVFSNDPFLPATDRDGSELLAADTDGRSVWAVGGGAASGSATREDGGPAAREAGNFPRKPLAVRTIVGSVAEVPIPASAYTDDERFVDVAVAPGSDTAWVAVQRYDQRKATNVKARVSALNPDGTIAFDQQLPSSGAGRGSAARIAFTAQNDGWMVTTAGWLFHYTEDESVAIDTDPAFAGTIDFRPNEAAEQFVPDTPPADDSGLLQPPPVIEEPPAPDPVPAPEQLVKGAKTKLKGRTLYLTFRLTRKANVQLVARRRGKVVAKTKAKLMKKGKHTLRLKLNPKKWPTKLQFKATEPGQSGSADDGDTITTKR